MRAAWLALDDERRDAVRATWREKRHAYAALDRKGRCAVYEGRPLVCRSHSVPVRFASRRGDHAGPSLSVIETCIHNFTTAVPEAADKDCVFDQTTLSAMLLLVDHEDAEVTERDPLSRFELAELARDP